MKDLHHFRAQRPLAVLAAEGRIFFSPTIIVLHAKAGRHESKKTRPQGENHSFDYLGEGVVTK
jgi:hypothetical protein